MSTQLRNMIRRFNLAVAKPKGGSGSSGGYRRLTRDVSVCRTISDDSEDVVWESMSSMTLQDGNVERRRSHFMMLGDNAPPNPNPQRRQQIPPETLLNDTITSGASDTTLLRIAEHFPGLLGLRGDYGRFPVHVACAYAASSDFIDKCVSLHPHTAAAQDDDGRTPFHILCKYYAKRCEASMFEDRRAIESRMRKIMWILYRKAPNAIITEDNRGVDVVEYALESDLSITFIGLLQDMVTRVRKSNAKEKARRKRMRSICL